MISIILDTNFLIYCSKYRIDYELEISRLFDEKYIMIITNQVLDEIESLIETMRGKEKAVIELAKAILDKKIKMGKIKVNELVSDSVDFSVIEAAKSSEKPVIASIDKELRNEAIKRLKNAQFLTIKQKTHLQVF